MTKMQCDASNRDKVTTYLTSNETTLELETLGINDMLGCAHTHALCKISLALCSVDTWRRCLRASRTGVVALGC